MSFEEEYTTADKIAANSLLPVKDQVDESKKIVVSNDAYCIGSLLELLYLAGRRPK